MAIFASSSILHLSARIGPYYQLHNNVWPVTFKSLLLFLLSCVDANIHMWHHSRRLRDSKYHTAASWGNSDDIAHARVLVQVMDIL
jgi:hypothetical protein